MESGPSQTRPSLRDLHSPQPLGKSTVEEDLKKLITLDSPPAIHHDGKVHTHTHAHWLKSRPTLSLRITTASNIAALSNRTVEFSFPIGQSYDLFCNSLCMLLVSAAVVLGCERFRPALAAAHPLRREYLSRPALAVTRRYGAGAGARQRRAVQLLHPATLAHHPRGPPAQTLLQTGHQDAW